MHTVSNATARPASQRDWHRPEATQNKRSTWRWRAVLVLIGLLSLALRVYYVTHAQVLQPVDDQQHVRADGVELYAYARNLVQHHTFSMAPEGTQPLVGDSFRDPGYPAFLAGGMLAFPTWDSWYAAILLSQAVLSALTVTLALTLARRWMTLRWLAGAGLLMAVWPHSVAMNSFILTETLVGFLALLGLTLLSRGIEAKRLGNAIVGSATWALAGLTNAVLLPFAPLAALYARWRGSITTPASIGLLVAALLLPAAWSIRNMTLPPGQSVTGRALINLDQGSWPRYHEAYQAAVKGDPAARGEMDRIDEEIKLLQRHPARGLQLIAQRLGSAPWHYLRWYLGKPALLWGWDIRMGQGDIYVYPTRFSPFITNAGFRAAWAVCRAANPWLFLAMMAACVWLAVRPRQLPISLLLSGLLVTYVTAVHTALQAEPRYSEPYRALEILLASWLVQEIVGKLRQSKGVSTDSG